MTWSAYLKMFYKPTISSKAILTMANQFSVNTVSKLIETHHSVHHPVILIWMANTQYADTTWSMLQASTNQGHINKLIGLFQSNMIYSHSYSTQWRDWGGKGGGSKIFLWQYSHISHTQRHICPPHGLHRRTAARRKPTAKIASDVVQSFCQIGWWENDTLSKGSMLMKRNLDARRLFLGTHDRLSTAAQMKWDAFS